MDLGFEYRLYRNGDLVISRYGRPVTRLSGGAAQRAAVRLDSLPRSLQQQLMARLTGNYKRGNEGPCH